MSSELSIECALARTALWCEQAVALTRLEMAGAAVAIALGVRAVAPRAVQVLLEDSDQGDWLVITGWADEQGFEHEVGDWPVSEEVDQAASHLYTPQVRHVVGVSEIREGRRVLGYRIGVDTVLAAHGRFARVDCRE